MKLKYTILYVEDVEKTLDFYVKAFHMKVAFLHEDSDYGELETGSTRLSFSSLQLMNQLGKAAIAPTPDSPCFEIAFETDDVVQSLDTAMNAGATLVQPVQQMPWGQKTAYVNDINGFLIELCSPVHD